jgi:outer membrane translocation and assembly module TamA
VERQKLKEIREVERAEKAAERARKVEAQHQKQAIHQAQQRKRKALQASSLKEMKIEMELHLLHRLYRERPHHVAATSTFHKNLDITS